MFIKKVCERGTYFTIKGTLVEDNVTCSSTTFVTVIVYFFFLVNACDARAQFFQFLSFSTTSPLRSNFFAYHLRVYTFAN